MPADAPTPRWLPRKEAAAFISANYFKVSPRTLERWPVGRKFVGGRAHLDMVAMIDHARQMLDAAPVVMQRSSRSPSAGAPVCGGAEISRRPRPASRPAKNLARGSHQTSKKARSMSERLNTPKPLANATPAETAREKQRAAPPLAPASAAVPMIDGMTIAEFIKASAEKLRRNMTATPGGGAGTTAYLKFNGNTGQWSLNGDEIDPIGIGRLVVPRSSLFEGVVEWAGGRPLQKIRAAAVRLRAQGADDGGAVAEPADAFGLRCRQQ